MIREHVHGGAIIKCVLLNSTLKISAGTEKYSLPLPLTRNHHVILHKWINILFVLQLELSQYNILAIVSNPPQIILTTTGLFRCGYWFFYRRRSSPKNRSSSRQHRDDDETMLCFFNFPLPSLMFKYSTHFNVICCAPQVSNNLYIQWSWVCTTH